MSSLPRRLLVLAATAASAACASTPQATDTTASAGAAAAVGAPPMVATLAAVSSPITGLVRLEPTDRADQVRAAISVRGADIGAQLPWEIRQGRCGEEGNQIGPQAAYRVLSVRADGTADARVTLPITMPASGTYHVNVLLSRTSMDRPVACGVLSVDQ
jgi:hypothetical protein